MTTMYGYVWLCMTKTFSQNSNFLKIFILFINPWLFFTFVYLCIPLFTFVYICLPLLTFVYQFLNDASMHKFCACYGIMSKIAPLNYYNLINLITNLERSKTRFQFQIELSLALLSPSLFSTPSLKLSYNPWLRRFDCIAYLILFSPQSLVGYLTVNPYDQLMFWSSNFILIWNIGSGCLLPQSTYFMLTWLFFIN